MVAWRRFRAARTHCIKIMYHKTSQTTFVTLCGITYLHMRTEWQSTFSQFWFYPVSLLLSLRVLQLNSWQNVSHSILSPLFYPPCPFSVSFALCFSSPLLATTKLLELQGQCQFFLFVFQRKSVPQCGFVSNRITSIVSLHACLPSLRCI